MHTDTLQIGRTITPGKTACEVAEGTHSSHHLSLAREIILKHGWSAASYQIINPEMNLWFSSKEDAVAGYLIRNRVRAVAGMPVCDIKRLTTVAREFERDAAMAGEKVCYFGSELTPEPLLREKRSYSVIQLGSQPSWSPASWGEMLSLRATVRAQLNRARNKNVTVVECFGEDRQFKLEAERCLKEWLSTRGLPPLSFLAESQTLRQLFDRRLFLALREHRVVAYLVASPIPRRNGWLIEQNVRRKSAPNGTTELLIDAAVKTFAAEGSSYVTLGLAPLSARHTDAGKTNPLWIQLLFDGIRSYGEQLYNFKGIDAFKAKFSPQRWEPVFAISNEPSFSLSTLYALAATFSNGAPIKTILGSIFKGKS